MKVTNGDAETLEPPDNAGAAIMKSLSTLNELKIELRPTPRNIPKENECMQELHS